MPYAAGEHDGYAPQIGSTLRAGATQDEIADALRNIEKDEMGLGSAWARLSRERLSELGFEATGLTVPDEPAGGE